MDPYYFLYEPCTAYRQIPEVRVQMMRATLEVRRFFSLGLLKLGVQDVPQKPIWREKKIAASYVSDGKSHGLALYTTAMNMKYIYIYIFPTIWVKEPRHLETISYQNCYLFSSMRQMIDTSK